MPPPQGDMPGQIQLKKYNHATYMLNRKHRGIKKVRKKNFYFANFRGKHLKPDVWYKRSKSHSRPMQICELMSPNYTMFPCYYYKQPGCSSSVHQPANLLKVMGVRCQLLLAQCKAGDISKKCGSYFKVLFSKNEQYQKGPGISHKYICYHFRKILLKSHRFPKRGYIGQVQHFVRLLFYF